MFKFEQLDPRPVGAEKNAAVFAAGPVYGLEVTIPSLAELCVENLDHHGPGDTVKTPSACEQALGAELPEPGMTLATVRCDADSVTAMAVLVARVAGDQFNTDLVRQVGVMDRLGPSAGEQSNEVVAIARVSADFKMTLEQRVDWIRELLAGNSEQKSQVADLVAARDAEFADAMSASDVSLAANGRIAVVQSGHRFATNLGYAQAPMVVAFNPEMAVDFKDPKAGSYKKFTVCRYDSHVAADLESALAELQSMENGWGGRGDIFGSPQGVSSTLTLEEVTAVVEKHLQ